MAMTHTSTSLKETNMNHTYDTFRWVSQETLDAAKASDKKCCPTCRGYGVAGYVLNADQWVNCWKCNPTK